MFTRRTFLQHSLLACGALLAGCAEADESPAPAAAPLPKKPRVVVVVYSYTGNTLAAAEFIAKHTQGHLLRLEPQTPYPADYTDCTRVAKDELKRGFLPPLKPFDLDPASYDLLCVGSPNWWGTVAPPVRTFLADPRYAQGKFILPFFTHGGGGMQSCETDLRALTPGALRHLPGKTFSGYSIHRAEPQIAAWLTPLGL